MRQERGRRRFRDATGGTRAVLTVTVRPTVEDHERIERLARAYGMSVDQVLAQALRDGIDRALAHARGLGLDV